MAAKRSSLSCWPADSACVRSQNADDAGMPDAPDCACAPPDASAAASASSAPTSHKRDFARRQFLEHRVFEHQEECFARVGAGELDAVRAVLRVHEVAARQRLPGEHRLRQVEHDALRGSPACMATRVLPARPGVWSMSMIW